MQELPDVLEKRLIIEFSLSHYESSVLVHEVGAAAYFEAVASKKSRPAKLVCNWILNELFGLLKETHTSILDSPVSRGRMGELIDLIVDETISGKIAKVEHAVVFFCCRTVLSRF